MSLTQSYESQRDLLIGQLYKRSSTTVASGQAQTSNASVPFQNKILTYQRKSL